MNMRFLGTGAADIGVPDTCPCANCAAVRAAGGRSRRTYSSLLLDHSTLIDCGPTVPEQLTRLGNEGTTVVHLLMTHLHEDHAGSAAITELCRRAQQRGRTLTLWGGREAGRHVRDAVDASIPLSLGALQPFENVTVGDWQVTPLPARHMDDHPEAFVYLLSRNGRLLLYACDTGPLLDATVAHLRHCRLAAVVMEATFGLKSESDGIADLRKNHLNFPLAVAERGRLMDQGTVGPDTPWYATHLSLHHCPPHDESAAWLARHGLRLAWDGLRWSQQAAAPPDPRSSLGAETVDTAASPG
ncbi:MAG: hypothetical protein COZ06_07790 [Armatimonadetes bacterium CG_4_10_14_3_um_filter_66_18]|nr:MBL fold metallo-hydrolase [Armatimonadota bacterium]OIO93359.1 MAG: hypothetical protein AUJ96_30500 [Armatimonadetes bacterium CG2_30_66_41]PIU92225.1 MAG: hypothetical protein COS65_19015 [Armatimonadetes bacterium CG06_land_8_20_14_3_00_66_21]PIW20335.1 MAG: hypothetical protein COW34_02085 [Armatimonadetes bacterium CG17_big_fil_post_rev_8_21_14_2_50_66_6]PIX40565.1 MAG: hypothetical protein COZ57_25615 [Armatimonadetes bacterium CG_4_8_14_3_um_filter_66_20]PIY50749.1 MAG: hypothetical